MKVAYYSPMPPERSGIADYSALLVPALRRRLDVDVARRGKSARGDVALYHVGNDPESHGWIVEALRRRPGVVVLHEHVLHHLVAGLTLARADVHGYLNAMERDGGLVGRLLAHGVLDNRIPPLWETRPDEFPLNGEVLELAEALIVHSRFVEARVRAAGFDRPVFRIAHPAWPVPPIEPAAGVEGELVVGAFGHVNATKRTPQLLHAVSLVPGARLLLVGALSERYELDVPPDVQREEYVDEPRLWSLMAACDVVVSLRAPTMGETSGTAIRALSLGKPLVVSDLGWFAELPDEVALKVPVGEGEVETLAASLELLRREPARREAMSRAARALAESEHALPRVAEAYAAAVETAAGGGAVPDAVLREVAQAAADVGLADTGELAVRLAEVGLGG